MGLCSAVELKSTLMENSKYNGKLDKGLIFFLKEINISDRKSESGIPWKSNLPQLGYFSSFTEFGSIGTNQRKQNLQKSDHHDEVTVEQPHVVLAVLGEDITIPCIVHNMPPDSIYEGIWRIGYSDLCWENGIFVNVKVNRTMLTIGQLSLIIRNVQSHFSGHYCCELKTRVKIPPEHQAVHGTQLVIADPNESIPEFKITQSGEISVNKGDAVIINCSYIVPPGKVPLWTGVVFWRVGSPRGIYAYHPSKLMVHPSYNGRTELKGRANLHLKEVQEVDNATYYCFVMLKFCIGPHSTTSMIQYGRGTQIKILGITEDHICISKAQNVCADQPGSIRVEERETVTIPCYFSYPENINPTKVRVSWRTAASGKCAQSDFIYNHTDKWINTSYQREFKVQGGIMTNRMAAITITILKKLKKSMFCCRIELDHDNQSPDLKWQNPHGTYMLFKDEASAEQPDVILAVLGEDAAIPCIVHNINPESIREVTLRKGASDVCSENKEVKTRLGHDHIKEYVWQSPQENTWKLLLPIKKVRSSDIGQYCCDVRTTPEIPPARQPAHGTQVVIVDPKDSPPEFTATQPGEISAQRGDTVTINCLYHVPPGQTPLWIGVFWRVGGPSGIYAYHPYRLMVDSSYYGRTELEGLANLHIKDIVETDNATYYCFVMLKFCTGNHSAQSVIQYGGGTQLTIIGKPEDHNTSVQLSRQTVILVSYAAMKAFLLFIAVIFSFVYVKKCA
ncbi:uncharacterized protein [Hyperolius riggenbachi]|uniref:uncharacterized protein isoform X6 n=1 Tax=Hyperolius riggenbachi TaxID=752182 RepID=UPI0035A3920F